MNSSCAVVRIPVVALLLSVACGVSSLARAQDAAPAPKPNLPAVPELNPVSRFSGAVELPGGMKLEFSVVLVPAVGEQPTGGMISIPAQGLKDGALSDVEVGNDRVKFTLKPPGAPEAAWARFEATPVAGEEPAWKGTLKQAGQEFPVSLRKTLAGEDAPAKPKRPQTPAPPFPYDQEQVSFAVNPGGHVIAGTLTKPRGEGKRAAVVLISGSGPHDRDATMFEHKPFALLADALTRAGVIVLRCDDRGVNGSTLPPGQSMGDVTTMNFADDAQAAVEFLAKRPDVDAAKIGLIGHSEGGVVAPIVAARSKDVAFVVLLAAPALPGREIMTTQSVEIVRAGGGSPETLAKIEKAHRALMDILEDPAARRDVIEPAVVELTRVQLEAQGMPVDQAVMMAKQSMPMLESRWMREYLRLDPREHLRRVTQPVLALNGERDTQVPAETNLGEISKALEAAGNKAFEVEALPGLNHLFQTSTTGSPAEYPTIEETFAPAALERVVAWVKARAGM